MNIDTSSAEQIMAAAAQLYIKHGKFGDKLLPVEAERALEAESDKITAFVATHFRDMASILKATTDPAIEAEHKQLAVNFYSVLVRSLSGMTNLNVQS